MHQTAGHEEVFILAESPHFYLTRLFLHLWAVVFGLQQKRGSSSGKRESPLKRKLIEKMDLLSSGNQGDSLALLNPKVPQHID